jgi:cytochrome c peroxidase
VVEKPGAELLPPADKGRFMVTKTPSDEYVLKVPTLRNITLTAPYFHTGQAWDLRQAVAVMGTSQLVLSSPITRSTRSPPFSGV